MKPFWCSITSHRRTLFINVVVLCLQEASIQVKSVRQLLGQCKDSFNGLVKFFGDNPQALANDAAYWADIITFVNRFTTCQREVMKRLQVSLSLRWGSVSVSLLLISMSKRLLPCLCLSNAF